ncbi:MAG: bifunctional [glutamate--ammonia ligase]-adenylyl-L-tyrosine phosphorylase/[glutamate--ammonia-ligase] adenylyltransferase [Limisphaerales bacterium]
MQLRQTAAAGFLDKLSGEQARILAAVLGGSQALGELLAGRPDWLKPLLEPGFLNFPRREEGLRHQIGRLLEPLLERQDYEAAFASLRQFKQREMLRIAARDLARLTGALEITREISQVADVCLDVVCRLCRQSMAARLGRPYYLDADGRWQESQFCVLGLGKLGGHELNYSSDVDVLFVYTEEGNVFKTPPRPGQQPGKAMSNHQFFARLAEKWIAEIVLMTPDGSLFRVDARLRPEGKAGPLVRSLESYENYYAEWGQTWERMMLIKARPVSGDKGLGDEFVEMVQSFRYPRSLSQRTMREVAAVKKRIEKEVVKAGELDRNVKLGRGGIREIEFIVQTLQILRAGRIPFLQGASTVPVLRKLAEYALLSGPEAKQLEEAYIFLRDVEHRLQMEAGQQTHTIPADRRSCERLARLMGFASLPAFEAARRAHTGQVRRIYDRLLAGDEPEPSSVLPDDTEDSEKAWLELFSRHSFRDPARAWQMVQILLHGPGYVHVSPRTVELARELLPRFLALCPQTTGGAPLPPKTGPVLSDPDRVLVRLDSFIDAYGARATLYELWTQQPSLFEMLLLLFDRSEFLAERAIRAPDLVYELEISGRVRRQKSAAETLRDLRRGADDADQRLWLRRYHQAELMRIGLRDILGLADFEQNLLELSALADACLQYALEVVAHQARFKSLPLCVVGLGKLGGREINYGSDLDIVFVANCAAKSLPRLQRLAAAFLDLLGSQTEMGAVFHLDTRLRPDGEKGLLVNTVEACEEYYRKRAGLWEIQALTRLRPIAGDLEAGAQFQQLAAALADFSPENVAAGFAVPTARPGKTSRQTGLSAYTPDWMKEIDAMRERTVRERTPPGKDRLAIKTGVGGLMDAEFLAQAFCLARGWQEANSLSALRRGGEEGLLARADAESLLRNYATLRRIECILRRWSYEGEILLPDDEPAQYRVAVRCGYACPGDFMQALESTRAAIHAVYVKYFRAASVAQLSLKHE